MNASAARTTRKVTAGSAAGTMASNAPRTIPGRIAGAIRIFAGTAAREKKPERAAMDGMIGSSDAKLTVTASFHSKKSPSAAEMQKIADRRGQ